MHGVEVCLYQRAGVLGNVEVNLAENSVGVRGMDAIDCLGGWVGLASMVSFRTLFLKNDGKILSSRGEREATTEKTKKVSPRERTWCAVDPHASHAF
jgi:hypothetical protein